MMIPALTRVPRTEDNFIRTYTGRKFWPLDPRADEICIEDVAHHLSLECRFTGATHCHYSVADHSLRVSKLAEQMTLRSCRNMTMARNVALWGLLHDASEAYLKDLPRPLKHAPGIGDLYRAIEASIMRAVVERFDLSTIEPPVVKEADNILLNTEKRDLMTGCQERFGLDRLLETIRPLDSLNAEVLFLRRFRALTMARAVDIGSLDDQEPVRLGLDPDSEAHRNGQITAAELVERRSRALGAHKIEIEVMAAKARAHAPESGHNFDL